MTTQRFSDVARQLAAHRSEIDEQRAREYEEHDRLLAEFATYARSRAAPPGVRALADWVDRGELSWSEAALHHLLEGPADGAR